jgi:hypothetical protein
MSAEASALLLLAELSSRVREAGEGFVKPAYRGVMLATGGRCTGFGVPIGSEIRSASPRKYFVR